MDPSFQARPLAVPQGLHARHLLYLQEFPLHHSASSLRQSQWFLAIDCIPGLFLDNVQLVIHSVANPILRLH